MAVFQQYLDLAVNIIREAGTYSLEAQRGSLSITSKSNEFDLVTHVDKHNEALIRKRVAEVFPDHHILGEEEGGTLEDISGIKWIVDPLDGTLNFAHGLPIWCISIGIEVEGIMQCGVIFDPSRNELFTAINGEGAFLNGSPITVSKTSYPPHSMYATGFPYNIAEDPYGDIGRVVRFLKRGMVITRLGSPALDLAYVACGRFDAYHEVGLGPWDTAAGSLLVREAGGITVHFDGSPYSIYRLSIIASNGLQQGFLKEMVGEEFFKR